MVFFVKGALQVAKAMPSNQAQPELLAAAARSSSAVAAQPRLRRWLATALVEKHQTYGRHTATQAVVNFDSLAIDLDDAAPEPGGDLNLALGNASKQPASPGAGHPAPVTPEVAPRRAVLPARPEPPAAKAATHRQQKAQSAPTSQPAPASQSAPVLERVSTKLASSLAMHMNTQMEAIEERFQATAVKHHVKSEQPKRKREIVEETSQVDDDDEDAEMVKKGKKAKK